MSGKTDQNTNEMPQRPRYPSKSAIVHMVLRTAGILVNIVLLVFLGSLTEIYHETYPVAYVAVCTQPSYPYHTYETNHLC
jgi:hypothetical protein